MISLTNRQVLLMFTEVSFVVTLKTVLAQRRTFGNRCKGGLGEQITVYICDLDLQLIDFFVALRSDLKFQDVCSLCQSHEDFNWHLSVFSRLPSHPVQGLMMQLKGVFVVCCGDYLVLEFIHLTISYTYL